MNEVCDTLYSPYVVVVGFLIFSLLTSYCFLKNTFIVSSWFVDIVLYLYTLPIDHLLYSSLCIKLQLEPSISLIKMPLFCPTIAEFSFIHCEHKGIHCSIAMNDSMMVENIIVSILTEEHWNLKVWNLVLKLTPTHYRVAASQQL